jgi:hypothetical protein
VERVGIYPVVLIFPLRWYSFKMNLYIKFAVYLNKELQ